MSSKIIQHLFTINLKHNPLQLPSWLQFTKKVSSVIAPTASDLKKNVFLALPRKYMSLWLTPKLNGKFLLDLIVTSKVQTPRQSLSLFFAFIVIQAISKNVFGASSRMQEACGFKH